MVKLKRRGREVELPAVRFKGSDGLAVVAPLVEKGATAGTHCRVRSPNWYGRVDGRHVPLCPNKAASEQLLAAKLGEAALAKAGVGDCYAAPQARPLAEHLADYRRELEARDNVPRYVKMVVRGLEELFAGCGFERPRDFDAGKASQWLASRRAGESARPNLDPKQEEYTRAEVAELLGVKPFSVPPLVRRHRLAAEGNGRARRYPRTTVEALLDAREGAVSVATANAHLTHLKGF